MSFHDDSYYQQNEQAKRFLNYFANLEEIDFNQIDIPNFSETLQEYLSCSLAFEDRKKFEDITVKYIEFLENKNFGLMSELSKSDKE